MGYFPPVPFLNLVFYFFGIENAFIAEDYFPFSIYLLRFILLQIPGDSNVIT